MKRRNFLKSLGMATASLALGNCASRAHNRTDRKPNIIFILADDLGYGDLGCYGQKKVQTPRLDTLAAQGVRFTQFYAGSTVCAPSRSSLMTGQHTGHTPIRGNAEVQPEGQKPLPKGTITLARLMQQAGYATGAMGKWGLGFPGSEGDPNHQGFDYFFGYNCQAQAHHYYPTHLWRNQEKVLLEGNAKGGRQVYAQDLIAQEALDFVRRNREKPFFLYLPFTLPHAELHTPEAEMRPYRGQFDEIAPFGKPNAPYGFKGYNAQPQPRTAFAAMVSRLDSDVGRLLDLLKELGLEQNTLVFFTSDNGPHQEGGADPTFFRSSGPLRGIKRDLYEGGIRVPLLVRWPQKIRPGWVCEEIAAFWDILPTCCEAADSPIPHRVDGLSILPVLQEKPPHKERHDYLYWEFLEQGGKRAVREGKWKAVFFHKTRILELYDLEQDPTEQNNIAARHRDIAQKLFDRMREAHTDSPLFKIEPLPDSFEIASVSEESKNSNTEEPLTKV